VLRLPSKATLRKYGLTIRSWTALLKQQGGKCPICDRIFSLKIRSVIDHEHVKGFKKLPISERARYVRGLCCVSCNWQVLRKAVTLEKARNVVAYLERYTGRTCMRCSGRGWFMNPFDQKITCDHK